MLLRCPCGWSSEIAADTTTLVCPSCGKKLLVRLKKTRNETASPDLPQEGQIVSVASFRGRPAAKNGLWVGVGAAIALVLLVVIVLVLNPFSGTQPDPAVVAAKSTTQTPDPRKQDAREKSATVQPSSPTPEAVKAVTKTSVSEPPAKSTPPSSIPPEPEKKKEEAKGSSKLRMVKLDENTLAGTVTVLDFDTAKTPYSVYQTQVKEPPAKKLRFGLVGCGDNFNEYVMAKFRPAEERMPHDEVSFDADLFERNKLQDFDYLGFGSGFGTDRGREEKAAAQMRKFVAMGGVLFADHCYDFVLAAFPELRPRSRPLPVLGQDLPMATVVDPRLKQFLGAATVYAACVANGPADSEGKLPHVIPAAFDRERCTVLLESDYVSQYSPGKGRGAMLVRFRHGKGVVFFSCLHSPSHKQHHKVMEFVVYSMLTTRYETMLEEIMAHADAVPAARHLASAKAPFATTFEHDAGDLHVGVGFNGLDARFALALTSPDGLRIEHTGTTTFTVQIAKAAPGTWRIEARAVSVPFVNFPISVTVGKHGGK